MIRWARALCGALALLVSQRYVVQGDSMAPAFPHGHRLLVARWGFLASPPRRGEVVVVRDPRDPRRRYLKRVVGLPGEAVELREGLLWVDGVPLEETYLRGLPSCLATERHNWRLDAHRFVVLGDNRVRSSDSREFGPVERRHLVGRVWLRYRPLTAAGLIRPGLLRPRHR